MMNTLLSNIKWDNDGLIPAIIQDENTDQVLMLGYMNAEAIKQTFSTNNVTFYSRSRQTLWMKGETSGNTLSVSQISMDCDSDTLLIKAQPAGPTCHTGETSCFFKDLKTTNNGDNAKQKRTPNSRRTLEDLMDTVMDRKNTPQEGSYTNYLIDSGLGKILKKVGEESSEIIIASLSEDKSALVGEIGDLLYHLTVLMAEKEINWSEILELLDARSA